MNQSSVILLLCLSPLLVIFLVIKISLWITETMRFSSETDNSISDDLLTSSTEEEDDLEIPAFLRRQKN